MSTSAPCPSERDARGRGVPRVGTIRPEFRRIPRREYLLDEVGVAVLRGTAFGPLGEGHIRLSYANSIVNLTAATDRIASFLGAAVPQ